MKVKELIAALQQLPPEADLVQYLDADLYARVLVQPKLKMLFPSLCGQEYLTWVDDGVGPGVECVKLDVDDMR